MFLKKLIITISCFLFLIGTPTLNTQAQKTTTTQKTFSKEGERRKAVGKTNAVLKTTKANREVVKKLQSKIKKAEKSIAAKKKSGKLKGEALKKKQANLKLAKKKLQEFNKYNSKQSQKAKEIKKQLKSVENKK